MSNATLTAPVATTPALALSSHARARRTIVNVLRDVWRRDQVSPQQRALLRPRHLLLVGPTGSGKTTLLRTQLTASNQPFSRVSAAGWLRSGDDAPSAESLVAGLVEAARTQRDEASDAALGAAVLWIDDVQTLVVNEDDDNASMARALQRELVRLLDETSFATSVGVVTTDELLLVLSGTTSSGKPPELFPDLGARMVAQIMLEPLGDADLVALLREPSLPFCARYVALAAADGLTLSFEDEALEELAAIANELNARHDDMGAHRLAGLLDRVVDRHLPTGLDDDDANDDDAADAGDDAPDDVGSDLDADADADPTMVTITAAMIEEQLADLLEDDDLDGAIL